MVPQETELQVAMVSRVTPAPVEMQESQGLRELQDPKEMTENLENQAMITIFQDCQEPKGPKGIEDLRADRDRQGPLDQQELTSARSSISS